MLLCLNLMLLISLQTAWSSPLTTPSRGCTACKTKPSQSHSTPSNGSALALGASCGVYTQGCAPGLRCAPPEDEPRPLRALLEGRGVCSASSSPSPTTVFNGADATATDDPQEAPCRKLLNTLIKGLEAHLFKLHHDIYMPNCDRRGFFRRKQCWSSRGKQRGKCWCVNENGMPVTSVAKNKGSLSC
ncbi:insulin-like growth factor-binding protein 5 [Cynoglossus semilaevis]|uniref:Insulin-like growth factor-binding protein 5 n=1 Tax=Cynoglossus semilaevis TaxID=244447 RepID=A0A3P8V0U5_CYNSE|nr:insulin-like growth factor-binding protein 5 [Cynoglossus semilaevis]